MESYLLTNEYLIAAAVVTLTTAAVLEAWFQSDLPVMLCRLLSCRAKGSFFKHHDPLTGMTIMPDMWTRNDWEAWAEERLHIGVFPVGHLLVCPVCLSWWVCGVLSIVASVYIGEWEFMIVFPSLKFIATKLLK
jgi:hypothetical protein